MLGPVTSLLNVLTVVLAPILLVYSLVVWHGQYDSKALPVMIGLAFLLAVRAVTSYSHALLGTGLSEFVGALALALAMLLLFFSLRSYVHATLKLVKEKKLVSRKKHKRQRTRS